MEKCYKRGEHTYVVRFEDDKPEVFIGINEPLSILAIQLLFDAIVPLGWERTNSYKDVLCNGHYCIAVGYRVPGGVDAEKAITQLFS